jgi:hypothetical protein
MFGGHPPPVLLKSNAVQVQDAVRNDTNISPTPPVPKAAEQEKAEVPALPPAVRRQIPKAPEIDVNPKTEIAALTEPMGASARYLSNHVMCSVHFIVG